MPYNYNISPAARSGSGPYGRVPGNIGLPPNLYQGVSNVYPGLSSTTRDVGNVIDSQARGVLTNETINNIQDEAARFGVTSGMPLRGAPSSLAGYGGLRNLGRKVEDEQQKGVENYNKFLSTLASTVTDPNLAAMIASWNANNNAAPDPTMAANQQQRDYLAAMNAAMSAGRSPAGGTMGGSRGPNWWQTGDPSGGGGAGTIVANSLSDATMSGGTPVTQGFNDWYSGLNRNGWITTPLTEDDVWGYLGVDVNGPPAGTVTNDTSSTYDPFYDMETGYN